MSSDKFSFLGTHTHYEKDNNNNNPTINHYIYVLNQTNLSLQNFLSGKHNVKYVLFMRWIKDFTHLKLFSLCAKKNVFFCKTNLIKKLEKIWIYNFKMNHNW